MLEVEVSTTEPHVQSRVGYTIRILHALPLQKASLTEPVADKAIVQQLGEDRHYETHRDGQNYLLNGRRRKNLDTQNLLEDGDAFGALRVTGRVADLHVLGPDLLARAQVLTAPRLVVLC